ncbi:MAG: hypothetical protein ACE5FT_05195 [Candidatus Nanoarchaeia archaeon]
MSKISFLILLLIIPIVYADVTYTGPIKIPEGAVDTTHCPCELDIEKDPAPQIQACEDCIRAEVEKWAGTQEDEPAPSLLPTEHRQEEEIRRLEKKRKMQRMQQAIDIRARKDRMRSFMGKLKSTGLTQNEFKDMLHLIDELVYDNRYDVNAMNALKELKSRMIGNYEKRQKER